METQREWKRKVTGKIAIKRSWSNPDGYTLTCTSMYIPQLYYDHDLIFICNVDIVNRPGFNFSVNNHVTWFNLNCLRFSHFRKVLQVEQVKRFQSSTLDFLNETPDVILHTDRNRCATFSDKTMEVFVRHAKERFTVHTSRNLVHFLYIFIRIFGTLHLTLSLVIVSKLSTFVTHYESGIFR